MLDQNQHQHKLGTACIREDFIEISELDFQKEVAKILRNSAQSAVPADNAAYASLCLSTKTTSAQSSSSKGDLRYAEYIKTFKKY